MVVKDAYDVLDRWLKRRSFAPESSARHVLPIVVFFIGLDLFAIFTPEYIMPRLRVIALAYADLWLHHFDVIQASVFRIIAGLLLGISIGIVFGIFMGTTPVLRAYGETFTKFLTGFPALALALLSVLWFQNVFHRVLFVMFIMIFPWYALGTADAIRGIPADYSNMVRSYRFTRYQYVRKLVIPQTIPNLVSITKTVVGYATRGIIIVELVGAGVGIGKSMFIAQSLFQIAELLAWTFMLVSIMFGFQAIIIVIEKSFLSWQTAGEQ